MSCNSCYKSITDAGREFCWYCLADLCYDCWDEVGHCGHPEAEYANKHPDPTKPIPTMER